MNAFDSSFRSSFALRIALALSIAGLLALPTSRALAQDDAMAPPAEASRDEAARDQTAEAAAAEEPAPEQGASDAAVADDAAPEADAPADLGAPASEEEPIAPTSDPVIAEDIAAETAAASAAAEGAEAEEEEETAPAAEPSPFRGSLFSWQHGLTVNTLDPSAQLSYDPTYYQSFFLQGRYYLDRQNFFVLSQGLSVELTDANYTTTQREPQLSDTSLEWRHIEVVEGFVFIPAVRLAAPLSTWSQAAGRVLNTGAGITIVKVFPELASFTVAATGSYRRWWATRNVVVFENPEEPTPCYVGPNGDLCGGGGTTERDRFTAALTLTVMPLPGLTVLTQYAFAWAYGHPTGNTTLGSTDYTDDGNHWKNFHYWTLAVGYDVVPWLNLQIGYQSASFMTALYNDNGSVRNPFYNPESEVFLSATLALDVFVDEVIIGTEDEISPEQMQRRRQGLAGRTGVDTSF